MNKIRDIAPIVKKLILIVRRNNGKFWGKVAWEYGLFLTVVFDRYMHKQ